MSKTKPGEARRKAGAVIREGTRTGKEEAQMRMMTKLLFAVAAGTLLASAVAIVTAARSQEINTQTCRFGRDGYTCHDFTTGPVESQTKIAPFREIDPAQRLWEWENDCRTTLYFDKHNYAHAAEVAKRCGMQVQ